MRFLLKLKHWQLFLLTWGIPALMTILTLWNIQLLLIFFPLMMIANALGSFGWIWAISTELHKKLPPGVNLKIGLFKGLFMVPIVYLLLIIIWLGYNMYSRGVYAEKMQPFIGIVIFLHIFSMVCIFLGLRFAAKTMRSVELGRLARFSDYAGEFFLIWFSILGVWVLQPRLNKLSDN